ncbi:MAG: thiamine-phosphate kinase [Verrucomicrobiota bacterium]
MPLLNSGIFSNTDSTDKTVRSLGESEVIERIRQWLGSVTPATPLGIGDDCAIIETPAGMKQLLTTDSITYGQHIDGSVGAKDAGSKLIKRNVSDIAAMGGEPGPALLNLLMGPDVSIKWLEAFISGVKEASARYRISIVGGDMSELEAGHFSAALTLLGTAKQKPLLRHTAAISDWIFVTGTLGGSILGKHYAFEPRLIEGQWLAKQEEVTSMMDLTDGLGKDLAAILPDHASAEIETKRLPISSDARTFEQQDGKAAVEHAFCDGEDYELLFTLSTAADIDLFESDWKKEFPELELSRIGRITKAHPEGRYIDATTKKPLNWATGFEHFKKR